MTRLSPTAWRRDSQHQRVDNGADGVGRQQQWCNTAGIAPHSDSEAEAAGQERGGGGGEGEGEAERSIGGGGGGG
eukprot:COSAG01_NODE_24917_length_761_cov_28.364048_1_plen_74_part_10